MLYLFRHNAHSGPRTSPPFFLMAHAQEHAHFLGAIADKLWKKSPGSFILVSLGGVARAAFAQFVQQAQASQTAVEVSAHFAPPVEDGETEFEQGGQNANDFSVRQVTLDMMDALSDFAVTKLSKVAQKSPGPIAIPGSQMRHVLLLTDEYDTLRATRLNVLPTGELEVSVATEMLHNDRSFAVTGTIDLLKLLAEYPAEVAG